MGNCRRQPASLSSSLGVHLTFRKRCFIIVILLEKVFQKARVRYLVLVTASPLPLDSLDFSFSLCFFFFPRMGETVTFENKD